MTKSLQIEISDLQVSTDPEVVLVTYALGSCIAVVIHDPVRVAGGMIHYMLPLSQIAPEKAAANPAMFADTGVPHLFEKLYALGCRKQNLVVKVAGGGKIYDDHGTFDIGRRNYVVLRKLFWKSSVLIAAEDVGGSRSRTVRLSVATGDVIIYSQGEELKL